MQGVLQDGLLHGHSCTYFLKRTMAIILFCRSKIIEKSTSLHIHFLFYSLEENFVLSMFFEAPCEQCYKFDFSETVG